MPRTLRFDGETDAQFRLRAERAGRIGRILIDACLANVCVRDLIEDEELPHYTLEGFRRDPIVRIGFDEAYAIAHIGEGLAATKSKHWGDGPRILPLEEFDYVDPMFIGYVYKPTSRYNRRFEQRQRLKELLGKQYRPLVGKAKYHTKRVFLDVITEDQAEAIRRRIGVEPGIFWRAAKGEQFLDLPAREVQLELFER
jgi:hypothetical protein